MSLPSDSISDLIILARRAMPILSKSMDDEDLTMFALRFLVSNGDELEEEAREDAEEET